MYSESDWINKSIETGVKFKLRNSLSVGGGGKKMLDSREHQRDKESI